MFRFITVYVYLKLIVSMVARLEKTLRTKMIPLKESFA